MSTTIPSSTIDQENLNPANLQPPTVNLEERPASVCSANDEGSASQRPFVCKFKTRNHFYVYDVNRNTILEVTPATYAIVDDYGVVPFEQIINRHRDSYSPDQIREAFHSIATAQREGGYYSCNRWRDTVYPLDEANLRLLYEERLHSLLLCVTEQCNLRCSYCPYSGTYSNHRSHSVKSMPWEIAVKAIDFLKSHSKLSEEINISFYGGEPLLNSALIQRCVEYAHKVFERKHVGHNMTTNGIHLKGAVCDTLIENDFSLLVSLDGPGLIHDRYRRTKGGGGTFATIMRNLEQLQQRNPEFYRHNVRFNIVLSPPYDYAAIREFVETSPLVKDNGINITDVGGDVDEMGATFLDRFTPEERRRNGMEEMKADFCDALIAQRFETIRDFDSECKFIHAMFGSSLEKMAYILQTPTAPLPELCHPGGICVPGMKKLFVSTDGNFFTCEKVGTTHDLLCLGTVDTGLNTAKAIAIIQSYSKAHDFCRFCPALRMCGLCFTHAESHGTFDGNLKKKKCDDYIHFWKRNLATLMEVIERNPKAFEYAKQMTFSKNW